MFKKRISLLLVFVLVASMLIGCGGDKAPADTPADAPTDTAEDTEDKDATPDADVKETYISIATGGTAGTYYPLGGAMAKLFNDHVDGVTANAQATGASVENIGLVANEETEVAFIQNDITYYAAEGIEAFADKGPITNLRGMAMLYPELVQIVATADSGIQSVEDMKGKKVAIGSSGSGTEANARQILAAHGLTYDDLGKADYLSFGEAADQLKDKQVDAAFVTAGLPTAAVTEVGQTSDIVIVPIEESKIQELIAEYPFYTKVTVPAGTYKNQDDDVDTAAVMAMLVVPESLDEELMYNMTKQLFEQRQVIIDTHDRGNDIKLETAIVGMPIELHPGAARYYEEQGIQ